MAFPFFGRRSDRVLGIDLGTSAMKMVELTRGGQSLELTNYGEAKTREYLATIKAAFEAPQKNSASPQSRGENSQGPVESSLKPPAPAPQITETQIGELLRELLLQAKVATRQAVISIPVFASFSTTLSFPATMKEEELKKAVPYEAKSHVPLPLAEVELDWVALAPKASAGPQATREVLIVAVPKEMVEKYQRIARQAKVELMAFEVETFSLARALGSRAPRAIVVDIGTFTTSLTIVEQGSVEISHSVEVAGSEFSRMVAQGLRVSLERAEELKKKEGILDRPGPGVRNVLLPFVDRLVAEIERLLAIYERRSNQRVETLILSGGSSRLPGLKEYMSARLKRAALIGEPFAGIEYPSALKPIVPELDSVFAIAVGLAMRELT